MLSSLIGKQLVLFCFEDSQLKTAQHEASPFYICYTDNHTTLSQIIITYSVAICSLVLACDASFPSFTRLHYKPNNDFCITMISGGWFLKTLANIDLAITHFSVEKSLLGCNCVVPENIHTTPLSPPPTPPITKEVFGSPHLTSSTICSFETLQS